MLIYSLILLLFSYVLYAIQGKHTNIFSGNIHIPRLVIVVLVQVLVMSLLAPVFCDNKFFMLHIINNISNILFIIILIYSSFFRKIKIQSSSYIFKYSLIIALPLLIHTLFYCMSLVGLYSLEPLANKAIIFSYFIIILIAVITEYLSSLFSNN